MAKRTTFDNWLFFPALLLALGGLFMVGSSSNYFAMKLTQDPSSLYLKHGLYVLVGLAACFFAATVSYRRLNSKHLMWVAFAVLVMLLLIVLLLMPSTNGAQRWIVIGSVRVQPSEFAKLFVVVFMAWLLTKNEGRANDPGTLIPGAAVLGSLAFLIYIEPDLGSAAMLLLIGGVMLFAAGLRWRYVAASATLGALALVGAVIAEPFRWARIKAWIALWLDPTGQHDGVSFQLHQSLLAIGSGGLTGVGLGLGQQKAYYVPASHTDFIYSVIGEELGLLGAGGLLIAFLLIFWRGMRTARNAKNEFGAHLALGLTCLLVIQALTNMAVCLGLLPTKGLPLPLISYGGSSLLASMLALGLLFNVSHDSG